MLSLTALAFSLATPIFGFALSLPPTLAPPRPAQVTESATEAPTPKRSRANRKSRSGRRGKKSARSAEREPPAVRAEPEPEPKPEPKPARMAEPAPPTVKPVPTPERAAALALPAVPTPVVEPATPPAGDTFTLLRKRAKFAKVHRALGIATWTMTALATAAGTVQYRNLYGMPFSTDLGDTPCVRGRAFPNQDQCSGTPWLHAITGFTAGGLYLSTLTLAALMPDPDHASVGKSEYAKTLRTHKILRWVHLGGMVSQIVLGTLIANPRLSGLDRANDYESTKKLAGAHLAVGYLTLGALTYAGTIMLW